MRQPVLITTATLALAGIGHAQVIEGFEGGIPGSWTAIGSFGTSGAVINVAPTEGASFAYLDNRVGFGGFSTIGYGGSSTAGTLLESAPIALVAGTELSFDYNFLDGDYVPFRDWFMAQLIDHGSGTVVATLGNAQVNSDFDCTSVGQIVPATGFPPAGISGGVVLFPATTLLPGGSASVAGNAYCGTTGWVHSTFTIAATADYRLRFITTNVLDFGVDSGVAIDNIAYSNPDPCVNCDLGDIVGIDSGGARAVYGSIQDALDDAGPSSLDTIVICEGHFCGDLFVLDQSDLTILGCGDVVIQGRMWMEGNSNVSVAGLDFDAGAEQNGVHLQPPNSGLSFDDISVYGASVSGFCSTVDCDLVNENVTVSNSNLSNNKRGTWLYGAGGPFYFSDSTIEGNTCEGALVGGDVVATFEANVIRFNGSYGVARTPGGGVPEDVTLLSNTIEDNNGTVVPGQSDADLGRYDLILDGTDVN